MAVAAPSTFATRASRSVGSKGGEAIADIQAGLPRGDRERWRAATLQAWTAREALFSPDWWLIVAAEVDSAPDELWDWLVGPASLDDPPSAEYVAVTRLTMAADSARVKLHRS